MSGSNVGREQEIFGSDRAMGESGVQQAWQRQPCAGHWHGGKPPRITQPTFSPQASLTSPSAQPGLILTRLFPLSMCRHREAKHTLGTGRCSSWKTQSITSRRSRLWKGGTGKPPGSATLPARGISCLCSSIALCASMLSLSRGSLSYAL